MTELPFPNRLLADGVVMLRPWRAADVPGKLMAFSDPVVQRFSWARTTPYTDVDARDHFAAQEQARLRGEELNFAFVEPHDDEDVLGGGSLELTCSPENFASQHVAERCGFVREGVLRSHMPFKGSRRDTVGFSLLPG